MVATCAVLALTGAGFAAYDDLSNQLAAEQHAVARLRHVQESLGQELTRATTASDAISDRVATVEGKIKAAPASTRVARAAKPSVFTVLTETGSGSGFVVSAEAGRSLLVTNFHVIADGYVNGDTSVVVRQGATRLDGHVVDVSESNDLAVIDVPGSLPMLSWSADRLPSGAPVLALGSPLGLGGTVTSGIVSTYRVLEGVTYLQFSAPISPGNSGGPVLGSSGKVVGVTVQKMVTEGAEGLGFAIPTDRVCAALDVC